MCAPVKRVLSTRQLREIGHEMRHGGLAVIIVKFPYGLDTTYMRWWRYRQGSVPK